MATRSSETETLKPYYDALNRILAGNPQRISKATKITLNAVSLEAGKSAGSIKKQRSVFAPLIREIQERARIQQENSKPGFLKVQKARHKASKERDKAMSFEALYKEALARELMLLIAWDEAVQALRRGGKVVPLRPKIEKST